MKRPVAGVFREVPYLFPGIDSRVPPSSRVNHKMGRDHASVDIAVAWLECGPTPKEGMRVAERYVMGRKDPEIVGEAGNGLDIYMAAVECQGHVINPVPASCHANQLN